MNDPSRNQLRIALPLALTMALSPLALDAYLPAFPAIADAFGVGVHRISLSISIYVFVLALGQLVGGPLSDRFGRSRVMLAGLAIFSGASFLLALTDSLETFILLRVVQAFGGGWATVCVPAVVRDKLSGREAARLFALIGFITMMAPGVAPGIGSLFLAGFGWPSIFLFLAVYALAMVFLMKVVLFRHSPPAPPQRNPVPVWQRYGAVLATFPALRFLLLQSLAFSVLLLFITHSSFIYQEHFGAGPTEFSLLFGANIILMLVVNLINRHLLLRLPPVRLLRWGVMMQATGAALLILVTVLMPRLWLFVPAMVITAGAMGAIGTNTQACYMEYFHEHGGTAAAILGAATFAGGGLVATASAFLPESVLSVVLAQAACAAMCLWLILTRKPDQTHSH